MKPVYKSGIIGTRHINSRGNTWHPWKGSNYEPKPKVEMLEIEVDDRPVGARKLRRKQQALYRRAGELYFHPNDARCANLAIRALELNDQIEARR